MLAQTLSFTVAGIQWETPTIYSLHLTPPQSAGFAFLPGQFVMIGLEHEGVLMKRPYSISSSPTRRQSIELTIRLTGPFTKRLSELVVGSEVWAQGPFGAFVFDEQVHHDIVLLAGGVGVAPEKAMLEFVADRGLSVSTILFYGNRTPQETAYHDQLTKLSQAYSQCRVVCTVDESSHGWTGEVGFIDHAMLVKYIGRDWDGKTFFVCGPPAFVETMMTVLESAQVDKTNIKTERFTGLSVK